MSEPDATETPPQPAETGRELTLRRISENPELVPAPPAAMARSSWALLSHAATLSRMISDTDFVPAPFRGKPGAIAAAMLLGHELGIGPMIALRQLYVTPKKTNDRGEEKGGEILIAAQLMRAVARRSGCDLWTEEYTSTRVTWCGRRPHSDHVESVTWTIDDAKRAKLVRQYSAWETTPRAMLSARASAELCRLIAEDVLSGVYALEEFRDDPAMVESARVIDQAPAPHPDEPPATEPPKDEPPKTHRRSTKAPGPAPSSEAAKPEAPAPAPTPKGSAGLSTQTIHDEGMSGEPPRPEPNATQPAAGTRAAGEATWQGLEVPGDAAAPPSAPPPSGPASPSDQGERSDGAEVTHVDTEVGVEAPSALPEESAGSSGLPFHIAEPMPSSQMVAMLCREAAVDRATLCLAASGGRTNSARELEPPEAAVAVEHLRAIIRGEERLGFLAGDGGKPRPAFVVLGDIELADRVRDRLSLLTTRHRDSAAVIVIDGGWTEGAGQVALWLRKQPRATLLDILAKVNERLAALQPQPPNEENDA